MYVIKKNNHFIILNIILLNKWYKLIMGMSNLKLQYIYSINLNFDKIYIIYLYSLLVILFQFLITQYFIIQNIQMLL